MMLNVSHRLARANQEKMSEMTLYCVRAYQRRPGERGSGNTNKCLQVEEKHANGDPSAPRQAPSTMSGSYRMGPWLDL